MTHRALVLCTGNSCRSQMAEGLWRAEGKGDWEVHLAGSNPAGFVHPIAVKVMEEIGVDISSQESKHLDQFADEPFDVVVTVCDNAAQDCPIFPHGRQKLHWPFDDPSHVEGSEEERLAAFRHTRDIIAARIREYLGSEAAKSQ